MSILQGIKDGFASVQAGLKTEVSKFKNANFLEAVVSGCAMVSAADGNVSSAEKQKMAGFLRQSEALSVFDADKVFKEFNAAVGRFDFDPGVGEGEALARISKLKGKPEAAIVVSVVVAVAKSDGNFDDDERRAVRKICDALGLSPDSYLS